MTINIVEKQNIDMLKLLIPITFLLLLSGCVSGPALPLEEKEWTFIMYFNGDNNLEPSLYEFIDKLAETGSDENLNIVVQTDTITSYLPLGSTTKRMFIEDGYPTITKDLGEQNMGNPDTLSDFISWAAKNFPAKKYALILWNHGSASLSTSLDETDDDILELPELVSALEGSGVKFELIGFDMCLFGNIDVDYAVSPYAKVRVGSSEVTYNNWDYVNVFEYLKANPNAEGKEIASKFVQTMSFSNNFTIGSPEDSLIISAVDLGKIPFVKEEFAKLVNLLSNDIENWDVLAKSKFSSDKYSLDTREEGLTDLHNFLTKLKFFTNNTAILEAANNTMQKIEDAVIETNAGKNHKDSLGLSFTFMDDIVFYDLFGEEYMQKSAFARETGFSDFLDKYNGKQSLYVSNISVYALPGEYVINEENPVVTILTNFYGENIVHKYMWVAKDMGDYYDMLFASDIVDFGSSEYTIKTYESGYNVENVKWDGMVRGISNGKEEIHAFSQPLDVVNDLFFSSGTYSMSSSPFKAEMIFNVAESGKMVEVRAYDSFEDQYLPFLPRVQLGDEFSPNGLRFWKETGELEYYETSNIITLDEGVKRTLTKAPNGKYTILLVVEDIVGNRIYDSVDVVVDF